MECNPKETLLFISFFILSIANKFASLIFDEKEVCIKFIDLNFFATLNGIKKNYKTLPKK